MFRLKWDKIHDLPFQNTLDIRNPWNEDKPVKISRDCQELPAEVGARLMSRFADHESGRYVQQPCRHAGYGLPVLRAHRRSVSIGNATCCRLPASSANDDGGDGPRKRIRTGRGTLSMVPERFIGISTHGAYMHCRRR